MLKKEIIQYLTKCINKGMFSERKAKQILSLPLVEIEPWEMSDETPWAKFNKEYPGKEWCFNSNEYVFLNALYDLPKVGYYVVNVTEIDVIPNSHMLEIDYYPTISDTLITQVNITALIFGTNITTKYIRVMGTKPGVYDDGQSKEIAITILKRLLVTLRIFTDYHESLDLYPVQVQKEKPRLNRGNMNRVEKRLEEVQYRAPRLIYLNKLPNSRTDTISTPSGIKQTTHQRPGHWRTLSHPKYKNHKKYLVHKGVRVKPYWVGDTETINEENVYKLIMSKEEL